MWLALWAAPVRTSREKTKPRAVHAMSVAMSVARQFRSAARATTREMHKKTKTRRRHPLAPLCAWSNCDSLEQCASRSACHRCSPHGLLTLAIRAGTAHSRSHARAVLAITYCSLPMPPTPCTSVCAAGAPSAQLGGAIAGAAAGTAANAACCLASCKARTAGTAQT